MYVSGVPGTGKALTVTLVVERLLERAASVNCTNLKPPGNVSEHLVTKLEGKPETYTLTSHRDYAATNGTKTVNVL